MKLFGRWDLTRYRRALNVVLVTVVVFLLFIIANPRVFLNFNIYNAVMTSVPIIMFLALSMVFVFTSGEMDPSFGSVMGFAGLAFAFVTTRTGNPYLGLLACFATAAVWGIINGILVTKLKLSSLVSTLGMMFFLRGVIMVLTQGNSTP